MDKKIVNIPEENNLVERPLMSEKEFKENLNRQKQLFQEDVLNGVLHLRDYYCVSKFKSVRRAIKRGHMSVFGDIYPHRPFNNRKTKFNELRKKIYGKLKKQTA